VGGDGAGDRLNEFASARALTLAAITPLSQAQLDFSPRPGRWSVGEVADHLLLAESQYRDEIGRLIELARSGRRPYIRRSFADANVSPLFLPDAVLTLLDVPFSIVGRFMPEAVRAAILEMPLVPVRNPDFSTPRPNRPAAALKADLANSIQRTRDLLARNADIDFRQLVSEHPLMGRTNVPQILTFLARHERRHHLQMEKVRQEASFPKT
jgi:DinB superfamily